MTVVQGNIINITADAIVHPTSSSLNLGGEVGAYFLDIVLDYQIFLLVGHALAKAGGQELRDALSQAAKNKSLTNVGDGKISGRKRSSISSFMI